MNCVNMIPWKSADQNLSVQQKAIGKIRDCFFKYMVMYFNINSIITEELLLIPSTVWYVWL